MLCRRCFSTSAHVPKWTDFSAAYEKLLGEARGDAGVQRLAEGIRRGERAVLAEAITLVESTNSTKQQRSQRLLTVILDGLKNDSALRERSDRSLRIGISGPPGAGKSTFIERFGCFLTGNGHKVACLTVDPSSRITGGSLLGDKTRMPKLSVDPNAFIRPSPTSGVLGGVTRTTSEAILLCEAAGFDLTIVETVGSPGRGSGQNEYVVADMTDLFMLMIPPAGGDELQAIKRGIMELSDLIVVNKSDGDLVPAARRTQLEYISALKFLPSRNTDWRPKVMRLSALTGEGLDKCWSTIQDYQKTTRDSGFFHAKRSRQNSLWMKRFIGEHLHDLFERDSSVSAVLSDVEKAVFEQVITPVAGAHFLLSIFLNKKQ